MLQPRLAGRYAKSLIDLAREQNQLEEVYADMVLLQSVCKQSRDFLNLVRSPIIAADKKNAIIEAVTAGKVTKLTSAFNKLLVQKGRENILTEIISAYIEQYNRIKDIHKIKLTTAQPITEDLKTALSQKIKADTSLENIALETVVDEELIGGFVLEFDNKLVDASVIRDLRDIKRQFQSNVYIRNIR